MRTSAAASLREHKIGVKICLTKSISFRSEGYLSTKLVIPSWELPEHRFLEGLGELLVGNDKGSATTLWELLIHFDDSEYPVMIAGNLFTKKDLVFKAAQNLAGDRSRALPSVGEDGITKIREMCRTVGIDPDSLL